MISFAKPGLTEDLYIVQSKSFINMLYGRCVHLTRSNMFTSEKPILSSERILYVWIMTSRVQLKKNISGRDLKGFGIRTN
jgi:hypothetical protein